VFDEPPEAVSTMEETKAEEEEEKEEGKP